MKKETFNEGWLYAPQSKKYMGTPEIPFEPVQLPHDAMIYRKRTAQAEGSCNSGYYPAGSCEYKKKFNVPADGKEKRMMLEFEGVYSQAMVYLNGVFIRQHTYGYTPFLVDMNGFLQYGKENEITVICRNTNDSRWYTGAGICRNVNLLSGDLCSILPGQTRISTENIFQDEAVILYEITVENRRTELVSLEILPEFWDGEGRVAGSVRIPLSLMPGEKGTVRQRIRIHQVKTWSPEHPDLYRCFCTIQDKETGEVLDSSQESFGIRTLKLDPARGLLLNGEAVKLRGGCVHHDNGLIGAVSVRAAEERKAYLLKKSGFNAVRSSHNPMSPEFLDACDRIGLLVMDEAFDTWNMNKNPYDYALHFEEQWEADIKAMVEKDCNHPSVILYSIGNEIQELGNHRGAATARKLADRVKALDPTRYTIQAVNLLMSSIGAGKTWFFKPDDLDVNHAMTELGDDRKRIMCAEPLGELTEEALCATDLVGYNYANARIPMEHEKNPDRIFCGTETFTEDIVYNWKQVCDFPWLIGDFCWTAWDYIGECGIGKADYAEGAGADYGQYPWRLAYCGDMDITGRRREQSYFRETVFGKADHPYILVESPEHYGKIPARTPWSYTDSQPSWNWKGRQGQRISVTVYSAEEEVELLINGKSLGRKAAGEKTGFLARYDTTYEEGEIRAVAYRNGKEVSSYELHSGKGETYPVMHKEKEILSLSDQELGYLQIICEDKSGIPAADTEVSFTLTVEGAGSLLGLGSACPYDDMAGNGECCKTWHGQAMAVIRPKQKGDIKVSLTCGERKQELIWTVK